MALVEQLGDGRWYVQPANIWHCYLPLCIYVNYKNVVYVFFKLVLINQLLGGMVNDTSMSKPYVHFCFNGGSEGANSSKLFDLCVWFYVCIRTGFVD